MLYHEHMFAVEYLLRITATQLPGTVFVSRFFHLVTSVLYFGVSLLSRGRTSGRRAMTVTKVGGSETVELPYRHSETRARAREHVQTGCACT